MAATDSSNLTVNAVVQNACAIGNGTLNFGNLALAVTAHAGTAGTTADSAANSGSTVSVICTLGATATINGGLGLNLTSRKMQSGSDRLTYQLYTDSGAGTPLDSGSGSIAYIGTGTAGSVSIFGKVASADIVAAKVGTYSDTVALTINYTP